MHLFAFYNKKNVRARECFGGRPVPQDSLRDAPLLLPPSDFLFCFFFALKKKIEARECLGNRLIPQKLPRCCFHH